MNMKKLALFFALLGVVLAVSCKKDNTDEGSGFDFTMVTLNIAEGYSSVSMLITSDSQLIPVTISSSTYSGKPAPPVTLTENAQVSCDPKDKVECQLTAEGIVVTPKKVGKTTLTVSPKDYYGDPVTCEIDVTDTPAVPVSVSISKTGTSFSDSVLQLNEGQSYDLQATVMTDKGTASLDTKLTWTVTSGSAYISVSESGRVTAKALSVDDPVSAQVKVTVQENTSLFDVVDVCISPLPPEPTDIVLTGLILNADNEMFLKKGKEETFYVKVQPDKASQDYEVSITWSETSSAYTYLQYQTSGQEVTLQGKLSNHKQFTVTVKAAANQAIKKSFKVYVCDYNAGDVKPGDYVFVKDGTFRKVDCGLRYAYDGQIWTNSYQGDDDKVSGSPKSCPADGYYGTGSVFVGVVVATGLPDEDDFMGCSHLANCRDGSNATGLYEYNTFRKSNFADFWNISAGASYHALVVKKDQSASIQWQKNTSDGQLSTYTYTYNGTPKVYQSQLYNIWAFSPDEAASDPDSWVYKQSGFVSHLLLNFYNNHQNSPGKCEVLPVQTINGYTDVPKISDGKGTTGWFLPGELEWLSIKNNFVIVNKSLTKAGSSRGAVTLSGYYWSMMEISATTVYKYQVVSTGVSRYSANKTDSYSTRAVLYL